MDVTGLRGVMNLRASGVELVCLGYVFYQSKDGIRSSHDGLGFRRVLFRSAPYRNSPCPATSSSSWRSRASQSASSAAEPSALRRARIFWFPRHTFFSDRKSVV